MYEQTDRKRYDFSSQTVRTDLFFTAKSSPAVGSRIVNEITIRERDVLAAQSHGITQRKSPVITRN